ncbi:MAG TPA: ABC transporter permease [Solirubrobacteraceae bacterium]|nr:ABC transporter permease [Solirubrobacteraceae bacterium]
MVSRVLATGTRVGGQLRHDPRTVALLLALPAVLITLLRLVYAHRRDEFDAVGAPLLSLFPLFTMFLVTSVAILRERRTGTLERLLATPLRKSELLAGYGLAFGAAAIAQAVIASAVALGPLGLHVASGAAWVITLCATVALLGMGMGLLASAFARTEFQVVQFFPATILPQLLLCGLLVPRAALRGVLHLISDALPMSYAVDAMQHLSRDSLASGVVVRDLCVIVAFALLAVSLGAATLRRQTD